MTKIEIVTAGERIVKDVTTYVSQPTSPVTAQPVNVGLVEISQSQPTQLIPGPVGPQGPKGDTGAPGADGIDGADSTVPGPQGPQGVKGDTGNTGPPGAASTVPGPQGPKGDTGSTGSQGPQGNPGATGSQGPQGNPGATGSTGAPGATGPGVAAGGTTGQVLTKTSATDYATYWSTIVGGAIVADAAPSSPAPGQMWFKSNEGNTYIWVDDLTSQQWVMQNVMPASGQFPVATAQTRNRIVNGAMQISQENGRHI